MKYLKAAAVAAMITAAILVTGCDAVSGTCTPSGNSSVTVVLTLGQTSVTNRAIFSKVHTTLTTPGGTASYVLHTPGSITLAQNSSVTLTLKTPVTHITSCTVTKVS